VKTAIFYDGRSMRPSAGKEVRSPCGVWRSTRGPTRESQWPRGL